MKICEREGLSRILIRQLNWVGLSWILKDELFLYPLYNLHSVCAVKPGTWLYLCVCADSLFLFSFQPCWRHGLRDGDVGLSVHLFDCWSISATICFMDCLGFLHRHSESLKHEPSGSSVSLCLFCLSHTSHTSKTLYHPHFELDVNSSCYL